MTTTPQRPHATFLAAGQNRAPSGRDRTQVDPRRAVWSSARSVFACNRPCPGSLPPRFVELAKAAAAQAKSCYVRALRDAKDRGVPSPEGKLLVHFRVYEDGSVGCTSIVKDELHSEDLTRCAVDVLKQANFAESPPKGPCADVNVPFSFIARESDAGTGSGP